jgi:hypothetical protein
MELVNSSVGLDILATFINEVTKSAETQTD